MENQTPTNQSSMVTNEHLISEVLRASNTPALVGHSCGTADWEEGPKDSPIFISFNHPPKLREGAAILDKGSGLYHLMMDGQFIEEIKYNEKVTVDNNVRIRQIKIELKAIREELSMQEYSKPQFLIDDEDEDEYQAQLELGWYKDELNSQIEKLEEELEFLETAKDARDEANLEGYSE